MGWVEAVVAVSALLNVVLGIFSKVQAGKVKTLSEGVKILEGAIDENKDLIATIPAGKAVTDTIKTFGQPVAALVDQARAVAHGVSVADLNEREDAIIAEERREREKEVLDRASK